MILTVRALPSAADTQGSQSPNVTVPLFSIAPRVPSGSKLADIVASSVNQASSGTSRNLVVADFAVDSDQEVAGHGAAPCRPRRTWRPRDSREYWQRPRFRCASAGR